MKNLDTEIIQAWAEFKVKQLRASSGFMFCRGTSYYDKELEQYDKNKVQQDGDAIVVYDPHATLDKPSEISSAVSSFVNNTPIEQDQDFSFELSTSQSFKWSTTNTTSTQTDISVKAGIPDIAEVTEKMSVTIGVSTSNTQASEKKQTWSLTPKIKCQANGTTKVSMVVRIQNYSIDWTARVKLSGNVAIWFRDKLNYPGGSGEHFLWFIPVNVVLQECKDNNLIDTAGYEVLPGGISTIASGKFEGSQGIDCQIQVDYVSESQNQVRSIRLTRANSPVIEVT